MSSNIELRLILDPPITDIQDLFDEMIILLNVKKPLNQHTKEYVLSMLNEFVKKLIDRSTRKGDDMLHWLDNIMFMKDNIIFEIITR